MTISTIVKIMAVSAMVLATASQTTIAKPAPYYKWQSKLNGKIVCNQTTLGSGWKKHSGPYKDSKCTKSGTP